MEKQKLFNLASTSKMVLIITMIVMLGSLFGAVSYLLKMPKTDLPIVNPVVETQCKVDLDCALAFMGECSPCSTSDEKLQCRYVSQEETIGVKKSYQRNPACPICPQPLKIQHTCKCANGKCEKVKIELVKEVIITTDKMEYEQLETVEIIVENSTDKSIRICTPLLGIERFDNDNWVPVRMVLGMCGVTGGYVYEVIESYDTIKYDWDQKEKLCNEPIDVVSEPVSRQVSDGVYRIKSIKMDLNNSDNKQTIYSNEFTIKEKSAVDASDWQTYRNEEFGFEVKYPKEWHFVKLPRRGNLISASKILLGTDANPGISIFFTVIDNPLKLSIPDWKNKSDEQYNREIIFSKENEIIINGEKYIQYIDTIQASKEELETGYLKPSQLQYQRINIYIDKNDSIYNIQWREADNATESDIDLLKIITQTFKFIEN